jgi:flavodoxin
MKALVVYYSWTGNTAKVARRLAEVMKADLEEIRETKKRRRVIGFMRSGFEAARKKKPPIEGLNNDPKGYDLVVIGAPLWAGTFASPVRSFLVRYGGGIKKAACFLTMGGEKEARSFTEMRDLLGKQPVATLTLRSRTVKKDLSFDEEAVPAIEAFAKSLKG